MLQTEGYQIGNICFAHAHDRVRSTPINLDRPVRLRDGAAAKDHVVDVTRDFPRGFRLQNPRVTHSEDFRWDLKIMQCYAQTIIDRPVRRWDRNSIMYSSRYLTTAAL